MLQAVAPRHARVRKFIQPSELARWCRDAGLDLQASRGMDYNPLTRRYWLSDDTSVNYLFACRKPGLMQHVASCAMLQRCCSTWTARWSTARPTWPAPPTTCARRTACSRCRYEHLRPMVGSGARGMLGAAFGVAPGDAGFDALRDDFLARYEAAHAARDTRSSTPCSRCSTRWSAAACPGASSPTRRCASPSRWCEGAGPACRVPPRWSAATARRTPSRTRQPLLEAARRLGLPPQRCVYVGDDLRDMQAGRAAGMATAGRRPGVTWAGRADRTTGAPTRCWRIPTSS